MEDSGYQDRSFYLWRELPRGFLLLIGLFLSLYSSISLANNDLQKLHKAHLQLANAPSDLKLQREYLNLFPKNKKQFDKLFSDKRGTNIESYIFSLEYAALRNPQKTFKLLVTLGSQLTLASNGANHLQFTLIKLANDNPMEFANQVEKMTSSKQKALVSFLSKGARGVPSGYRGLASLLERLNKNEVAFMLQSAARN